MNFERIQQTVDIETMQASHATIVGGGYNIAACLVRSGLGSLTLVDFDSVSGTNPARQDLDSADIGRLKVQVVADQIRRINPDVEIETIVGDFCSFPRDEFDALFGPTDLFVDAADSFPCHGRLNIESQRLGIPAIWIGMYRNGGAGEIVYSIPGETAACYRCICSSRYEAFKKGQTSIPSSGATIFDLHLLDSIAGQIALGMLTRGADNRMGKLIGQLGNRQLLQVKIDPEYRLGDKDIFGQNLGNDPAQFSFSTIALAMERDPNCPDCQPLPVRPVPTEEVDDATHPQAICHP